MRPSRTTATLVAGAFAVLALHIPIASARPGCLGRTATIVGTRGDDQLTGTRRADVIVGRGGTDSIDGAGGNDVICGGGGNDSLFGGPGRDLVSGDGGKDQIAGGPGNDTLDGGKGLDFANYFVSPGPVDVDLAAGIASGDGDDRLARIENIFGSVFDDDLTGDSSDNSIVGLDGDDRIAAGDGIDLIYDGVSPGSTGTDGDDQLDGGPSLDAVLYTASPAAVHVDLGAGSATGNGTDGLDGIEGVFGSLFADQLIGDAGRNLFLGLGGNDAIDGGDGADAVAYWLASGPVTANLETGQGSGPGEGTDTFTDVEGLLGSVGFGDDLRGDSGNNLLDGDGGDDEIDGLGGDDWLVGGPGDDEIEGGPGNYDLIDYSNTAFLEIVAAVTVDLSAGIANGQGADTFSAVEAVMGSALDDEITGDDETNLLFGLEGDDVIGGAGGNDFLDGGPGPDQLDGGPGTDQCVAATALTLCEGETAAPLHPVLDDAAFIEGLRRNFRRNF